MKYKYLWMAKVARYFADFFDESPHAIQHLAVWKPGKKDFEFSYRVEKIEGHEPSDHC